MNLRIARQDAGLSQEKAAQKVGVSYKTIHRWENGDPVPSNFLVLLAEVYGVPLDKILSVAMHTEAS